MLVHKCVQILGLRALPIGGCPWQGEGCQSDIDYSSLEAMLQQRNWVSKSTYLGSPETSASKWFYFFFFQHLERIKSKPNDTKDNGPAKSPLQKINPVVDYAKLLPTASEGWGKVMFSHISVHPSIHLSVHTPTRTGYTAVGVPLAFMQEDFLVSVTFHLNVF